MEFLFGWRSCPLLEGILLFKESEDITLPGSRFDDIAY